MHGTLSFAGNSSILCLYCAYSAQHRHSLTVGMIMHSPQAHLRKNECVSVQFKTLNIANEKVLIVSA